MHAQMQPMLVVGVCMSFVFATAQWCTECEHTWSTVLMLCTACKFAPHLPHYECWGSTSMHVQCCWVRGYLFLAWGLFAFYSTVCLSPSSRPSKHVIISPIRKKKNKLAVSNRLLRIAPTPLVEHLLLSPTGCQPATMGNSWSGPRNVEAAVGAARSAHQRLTHRKIRR